MRNDLSFGAVLAVIFMISAISCGLILKYRHLHAHKSVRIDDVGAVQSAHGAPTPRIGGVAIGMAIVVTVAFAPHALQHNFMLFSLSLLPVFAVGLAEDLGFGMSPRRRLFAAIVSSTLAVYLLNFWIMRLDIPGVDIMLGWAPVGIAFTIIATAGVCNAFNLVDGLNGLSSGIGVITALGMAAVAGQGGDMALAELNMMLVAALLGFLMFNYPTGKLFLGDAGAYSLGFILSWFAVAMLYRLPDVSTWAVLLLFFWPVADTMLAIYRRRAADTPSYQPDRLHFHQLVMRALEILWLGRGRRELANPLATLVMIPFIAVPVATGVLLWNQPFWSFLAVVVFAILFVASYILGMRFAAARGMWRSTGVQSDSIGLARPFAARTRMKPPVL